MVDAAKNDHEDHTEDNKAGSLQICSRYRYPSAKVDAPLTSPDKPVCKHKVEDERGRSQRRDPIWPQIPKSKRGPDYHQHEQLDSIQACDALNVSTNPAQTPHM